MSYLPHAERERAEQRPVKWTPILDAIEAVASRLGAAEEQAWRAIKSKCAAGSLTLEGIDEKGRPRRIERHWVIYITPWGARTPSGEHIETDMPDRESGGLIAFDRHRAHRDSRADEADGIEPHSLPPQRLRDVGADGQQLDELWSRVEHEFKRPDWSLGNVLSWITFNEPLQICEFADRRDLLAYRQYDHRRSGFFYLEPRIARADQLLMDALKTECVTAIRNGTMVPGAHWFGKKSYDLTDDLRFRRAEVTAIDWWRAAERYGYRASEPTDLIPLNRAIERYPENRETMMRIIEMAWKAGEVTLWGRRKGHSMPEPIREYHGLVIMWHADQPKGDYYAEAHAHPAQLGAGYHRHEWEDLAIPSADVERLYSSRETDRAFLWDNIKGALDAAAAKESTEAALTAEKARTVGMVGGTSAYETLAANAKKRRLKYKGVLAEWMGSKGIKFLSRMPPAEIAAAFRTYCEDKRPDVLPLLPSRLRSLEGPIIKILKGMKEAAANNANNDSDG